MEVCVPVNASAHVRKGKNRGSLTNPRDPSCYGPEDRSENNLRCFDKLPNSENTTISSTYNHLSMGGDKDASDVRKEDLAKRTSNSSISENCFLHCVQSPVDEIKLSGLLGGEITGVSEANEHATSVSRCSLPPSSMPTPSKLVSAMKETREKQGIPRKNLSVTWAPDVNDPIPTSVSHVPYPYSYKSKKYKNRKQKSGGKVSRGKKQSKKDNKQQARGKSKTIEPNSSNKENGGSVTLSESEGGNVINIHVEESHVDPFCGSSYLKKSVRGIHFPVAEAS